MKTIPRLTLVMLAMFVSPLALACDYPQRASVPDGNTATKEQMIEGQRGVKAYIAAMEEYLACIESAEQETVAGNDDLEEDARQQRIAMLNKKYNAAVDEMNLVAAEFNIQVRAFKERDQ